MKGPRGLLFNHEYEEDEEMTNNCLILAFQLYCVFDYDTPAPSSTSEGMKSVCNQI